MQITFNNIEVPEEELKAVVEKNMEQIQKQCRRKKVRRILTGCRCCSDFGRGRHRLLCMNPVLAEQIPLIGHLFERWKISRYTLENSARMRSRSAMAMSASPVGSR